MPPLNRERRILEDLFGDDITYLGETLGKNYPKQACRNKHLVFLTPKGKIILKRYTLPESARNEKHFYDFFYQNGLVKVPLVYHLDEQVLVAQFIESGKYDLFQTVTDWAKVHTEALGISSDQFKQEDWQDLISPLTKSPGIFGQVFDRLVSRLMEGLSNRLVSLTHRDLYENNILTEASSRKNYYIDFEKGGISHPVRDLSLLVFNCPEREEQLIRAYRANIGFDYPEIKRDIETALLLRLGILILALEKDERIPLWFKEKFQKEAKKQIEKRLT